MKMDWVAVRSLGVGLLGLLITTTSIFGQSEAVAYAVLANEPQLPASEVPRFGNFYSLAHSEWPPMPDNPDGYPVWQVGTDSYVNSDVFSELTMAQAHGSGPTIGGGTYLHDVVWAQDFALKVKNCKTPHNWRLRKACIFTCYNADLSLTASGLYVSWPGACGIRDRGLQLTSLSYKNCGLFFVGGLPQGYINASTSQAMGTSDVAEMVDQAWVCGKNEYPGGCDPTYSFEFAVRATMGLYPDLATAKPALAGFPLCVYDPSQDEALRNLNTSGVKTR